MLRITGGRSKASAPLAKVSWQPYYRPLRNFLANLEFRAHDVEGSLVHELTHSRQAVRIRPLSRSQAEGILQREFTPLKPKTLEGYLNLFTFHGQEGLTAVQPEKLADAEAALIQYMKLCQANGVRSLPGGFMRYIETPYEVEARLQESGYRMSNALK